VSGDGDGLVRSIRQRKERHWRWRREDEPGFARQAAQIGVLGWVIVLPALLGTFAGRWLDRRFDSGVFWTGPLLLLGVALGCWSAWRWMHER
jgi:ATP synthase protein I